MEIDLNAPGGSGGCSGLPEEESAGKGVARFRSIQQAYIFITGDRDLEFGVNGRGGFLAREATVVTTDFPNILANSLTKKLLQDYAEIGMGGLDQIITVVGLNSFKVQDRVRMGYLPDLATVAEDGAYADFAKMTDEKISYAPTKRGNLLPVSRETILNDDLGKIAAFPTRIARAARHTLKQFITNFFINNPAYDGDAVAWFHATHNNLGSLALSATELDAREIALFNQAEKDSNKALGLTLDWLMIPIQLKSTAYQINQNNEGTNQWYHRFGERNERIIVNEKLTDANDWYYGSMPQNAPFIEIGFVQDAREPQIVLQNDPTAGAAFTNDRITYKVRHEYGGDVIDFRGVGKNVVP